MLSLRQLLSSLKPALNKSVLDSTDKQNIIRLMQQYQSNHIDWQQYVYYNSKEYTRNLIEDGGNYNIMTMCWAPGQSSAVHGHENSQCFVKILSGRLTERTFPYPIAGELSNQVEQNRHLEFNNVTYIDDLLGVHQMINESSSEPAISLHIYAPKYQMCRLFDEVGLSSDNSHSVPVRFQSMFGLINEQ